MKIGSRALTPREVGLYQVDIIQVAFYDGGSGGIRTMEACARRCRELEIPFVLHPVGYTLLYGPHLEELREAAGLADLGMIIHDETSPQGGRLTGEKGDEFRTALRSLKSITAISIENAADTRDIRWFWDAYADSVTIDIGHLEAAGISSAEFMKALDDKTIGKINYVHLHRQDGWHDNLTDHWPLTAGCKELNGLEALLRRKQDFTVILEIAGTGGVPESLDLVRELYQRVSAEH